MIVGAATKQTSACQQPSTACQHIQASTSPFSPCRAPVGPNCDVLYNKTRYTPPGVYTNVAQLRRWVDANLACLKEGDICPWGGTW